MVQAFEFRDYQFDVQTRTITFRYATHFKSGEVLIHTEKLVLPEGMRKIPPETLKAFLDPLFVVLGISYYKLYFAPTFLLHIPLSAEQAHFFQQVYVKGLGEYLYQNKLDPKDIPLFPVDNNAKTSAYRIPTQRRSLIGIGGGKDSIVVSELLKDTNSSSFLLETEKEDPLALAVVQTIGSPLLTVKRFLDPILFEKRPNTYNGHIPISAIFAFTGLLSGLLYDFSYVVVGNEYSSNFGNTQYLGQSINHQWSKSAEFEELLRDYSQNFMSPDICYFSLLRPFHEIRIAEMFSQYPKYFDVFSSCNKNFKVFKERTKTLWCGECAKCAFVFLILAPFIPKPRLIALFGKNLLNDPELLTVYKELLGKGANKPFDCVGTFEESQVALSLLKDTYKDDYIVKTLLPVLDITPDQVSKIFQTHAAPCIPEEYLLRAVKSVYILGYGKEGKATEQYLKAKYPHLCIGIGDAQIDPEYLKKQEAYDLVIKSPGIHKSKVYIPYTTASNIFLNATKAFTIGITGSKGKSTVSTLIFHILKTAGIKVELLGNIGNPMITSLLQNEEEHSVKVVEFSSYMLDDIRYSPSIAVLLNLFPEHMTYHGSKEAYFKAKENIFAFQKEGDISLRYPVDEILPLKDAELPLLGEHNKKNIQVAVKVARIMQVSEAIIVQALKSFTPLPHRLELVGTFKGITFYDDANATAPEAAIFAIRALGNVDTIFLGGEDRGYDFTELEKTLREYGVKNIVLFPESGKRMLKSREGFTILETTSLKEAVDFAYKVTEQGKVCLLSMASPSYSLWKNFEEKGDLFQKLVREYSI